MRGEQGPAGAPSRASGGSPPQARGAVVVAVDFCLRRGVIPAGTRSNSSPTSTRPTPRGHPRVRGKQGIGGNTAHPKRLSLGCAFVNASPKKMKSILIARLARQQETTAQFQ